MMKKTVLSLFACALVLCVASVKAELVPVDQEAKSGDVLVEQTITIPEGYEFVSLTASFPLDFSGQLRIYNLDSEEPYEITADPYTGTVTWAFELLIDGIVVDTVNGTSSYTVTFDPTTLYIDDLVYSSEFDVNIGEEVVEMTAADFGGNIPSSFGAELVLSLVSFNIVADGMADNFLVGPVSSKISGDVDITLVTREITTTPEPATLAIMGLGLAGAGFAARRRIKK